MQKKGEVKITLYVPNSPVGKHLAKAWQHRGYGGVLLGEAEVLVISALGTKQYNKRFGYSYNGVYMSKMLK